MMIRQSPQNPGRHSSPFPTRLQLSDPTRGFASQRITQPVGCIAKSLPTRNSAPTSMTSYGLGGFSRFAAEPIYWIRIERMDGSLLFKIPLRKKDHEGKVVLESAVSDSAGIVRNVGMSGRAVLMTKRPGEADLPFLLLHMNDLFAEEKKPATSNGLLNTEMFEEEETQMQVEPSDPVKIVDQGKQFEVLSCATFTTDEHQEHVVDVSRLKIAISKTAIPSTS